MNESKDVIRGKVKRGLYQLRKKKKDAIRRAIVLNHLWTIKIDFFFDSL